MTVILPENYHVQQALEKRRVYCYTREQAQKQDIRPLRIGILNVMPRAESYEFNLLFPLGRSIIQIEPVWIRLKDHSYSSSNLSHLDNYYVSFREAVRERGFDGLLVTGAPVEEKEFEDIHYWSEFSEILAYARENVVSTLGICWGGLALARQLGINKVVYEKKIFGVFEGRNLDREHPVTGELDDLFFCPQSRHAGIPDEVLEARRDAGELRLLAHADQAGYFIFESADRRFLMHLGHPEYETGRLVEEYERDRAAGRTDVAPPANLDPAHPVNRWRSHSVEFFLQWLKDVYIRTPYII